eukprot:TRINITY_DN3684_c0_g6_i2.p1 TRINITY_DN3684_c0_g6~~TRINITY_DN3684_c0_g6_i2.p1  ORF type:complete len:179 (-),score=24.24 TRINITY_DN3684_c0_g6_i2:102-638(-)
MLISRQKDRTLDKIIDNLYLGDCYDSCDMNILKKHGITHILPVGIGLERKFPKNFTYYPEEINIHDLEHVELIPHFENCIKFIEEGRKKGNVYVHCAAGISRSSTVVIAYLMKCMNYDYEKAHALCKSGRSIIYPNRGFTLQLRLFHKLNYVYDPNHPEVLEMKKTIETYKVGDSYFW